MPQRGSLVRRGRPATSRAVVIERSLSDLKTESNPFINRLTGREPQQPIRRVIGEGPDQCPIVSSRTNVSNPVSYTHLRAHETVLDLVCRLMLAKKNKQYRYTTPRTLK